jgi:hypothetical protein
VGELELVWSRAWGFAALALPAALLLLARARRDPPELATGTLAIWHEVAARAATPAHASRPRVPPATWLVLAALAAGAIALAGPRLVAREGPRTWTVLVDGALAAGLAWLPEPGAEPTAERRIDRALDQALAWLTANAHADDVVRWIRGDGDERRTRAAEPPERAWLTARRPTSAADLASGGSGAGGARRLALDRPGTLLVGDRAPEPAPEHAGWFASGGAAVPGTIAVGPVGAAGSPGDHELLIWDGDAVVARGTAAAAGRVVLDAGRAPLPDLVRELAEVWAGARGVAVVFDGGAGSDAARLVVRGAGDAAAEGAVVARRDGWSARARGVAGGADTGGDAETAKGSGAPTVDVLASADATWLSGGARALVTWSPGRIDVRATSLEIAAGDPAQVAVSFAELFDAAFLPHPDVVPLADRAAAGPASERAPEIPLREPAPENPLTRAPLDAWLAGAAALLALLALVFGR